jgi:hypothetical protein
MPMNRVQFQPGMSLREFQARFGTEQQCRQALQEARWPWQTALSRPWAATAPE